MSVTFQGSRPFDYGVLTAVAQERQLEPRYRRVLAFGEVLDESISLYRRHWLRFAWVSAIWLLPSGLVMVWVSTVGLLQTFTALTQVQVGRNLPGTTAQQLASSLALLGITEVVWVLFWLGYITSILVMTDAYIHGTESSLALVFGRTLRAYVHTLVGGLLFALSFVVLALVATLILVVPFVDVLLVLAALVGGVLWWTRTVPRTTWLKWLIIIGMPWGLPTYFSIVWSLFLVATTVERRGPIDSMRRSAELVHGQWLRVFGIVTLAWTIVAVLQLAPSALIQLPLMVSSLTRGQVMQGAAEQAASMGVGVLSQVFFGSVAPIAFTLVFIDLRNRCEGVDIAERLSQFEALESSAIHG